MRDNKKLQQALEGVAAFSAQPEANVDESLDVGLTSSDAALDDAKGAPSAAFTKADLFDFLRENLTITVDGGYSYGGENRRTVKLELCGEVISSDSFDVKEVREYEG